MSDPRFKKPLLWLFPGRISEHHFLPLTPPTFSPQNTYSPHFFPPGSPLPFGPKKPPPARCAFSFFDSDPARSLVFRRAFDMEWVPKGRGSFFTLSLVQRGVSGLHLFSPPLFYSVVVVILHLFPNTPGEDGGFAPPSSAFPNVSFP